jgi:hypothetical protein
MTEWTSLLSGAAHTFAPGDDTPGGPPGLCDLLAKSDGVVTRLRALRVFGRAAHGGVPSRAAWNAALRQTVQLAGLSLKEFEFFADDVFGRQYCWTGAAILRIDLDPMGIVELGISLESVLHDFDWNLLESNVLSGGALQPSEYLVPTVPVCLGGEKTAQSVERTNADSYLVWISEVWEQVRALPEGAKVSFAFEE